LLDEIRKDARERMAKSVASLQQELTKIRTGRAHTSLLDHITVEYYGSQVPLNQVSNVGVEDSRTLTVTPWEKEMVAKVEKAIINSDLGLNPASAGTVIRVPLPPLTEERRKDLIRVVRHEAEGGRIAVRNIRRDAIHDLKELLKEKLIGEDDEHRAEEEIQAITDKYIAEIDEVLAAKEDELIHHGRQRPLGPQTRAAPARRSPVGCRSGAQDRRTCRPVRGSPFDAVCVQQRELVAATRRSQ
jgi:ribosome recycling factor